MVKLKNNATLTSIDSTTQEIHRFLWVDGSNVVVSDGDLIVNDLEWPNGGSISTVNQDTENTKNFIVRNVSRLQSNTGDHLKSSYFNLYGIHFQAKVLNFETYVDWRNAYNTMYVTFYGGEITADVIDMDDYLRIDAAPNFKINVNERLQARENDDVSGDIYMREYSMFQLNYTHFLELFRLKGKMYIGDRASFMYYAPSTFSPYCYIDCYDGDDSETLDSTGAYKALKWSGSSGEFSTAQYVLGTESSINQPVSVGLNYTDKYLIIEFGSAADIPWELLW
eukprot:CAMPEP_0201528712 /NCGR_PEP_ID=MMETSP0161_2-20130828/39311_1 /ASSEMBLY_ACC=CAM_ASM_000251 /TAXON_ID=180227 /ORGANISM="Neoparamoeba aestuarina, Strain SoJaBio B1-5/56/2" /LENGTH=280 /DNA_ID=CAMNT_0047930139 /DNA_START=294 /DNA_END=1133 /DNA_ORIENTATION=+